MAEAKRNSVTGKVATPKTASGPPSATAPAALDVFEGLGKALGAKVRIVTASNPSQTLEGSLFTACPMLNVVAINTRATTVTPNGTANPGDYHVLPVSRIQSFQILSLAPVADNGQNAFENIQPAVAPVDIKRLREREESRIKQLKDQEKDRGVGVTKEAQAIFDSFKRINMPIRWHNQEMIVDNSVIISPPYRSEDCKAGKEKQQALNHVRRVLEGERKKLKDREDRERKVSAPGGVRKGG